MKTLKLKVGKTYRSRNGKEVKIIKNDGALYPYQGDNGVWYTESGRFHYYTPESPNDLIEEVTSETRHTFSIPDGVKKITVEQVDNRIVVEMVPEIKEPKPGDVMINKHGSVYIFKSVVNSDIHKSFAWFGENGRLAIGGLCYSGRPATPEEAQPLWDTLKKAGKRWNAETMQIEEIPEVERIREWVWANLKSNLYAKGNVAEVIEHYLKHKEGEQ